MLSLVMPIYVPPGGEDVVYRCLDSIEKNTNGVCRFDERIVVINSMSTDDLRARIWCFTTENEDRQRLWRWFPEPIGFTKAFNIGLQMATGDVVQLNHDAIVPPGWLDQLVIDADRINGVVCCSDQHLRLPPGIHKDRGWGACFYLPRRVLDAVGPWDAEAFNYRYCDQDYWIRCKKAGFDVAVTGNVVLDHVNSHAFKHQLRQNGIAQAVAEEKREMIRRHGASDLASWLKIRKTIPKDC